VARSEQGSRSLKGAGQASWAPPIRDHKRERAKRPPRRPTRADSATPPVNEKTRLVSEAGLELGDPNGIEPRLSRYVVERRNETSSWMEPWRPEGGRMEDDGPKGMIPAKAWLMIFVVPGGSVASA
jgi:hypothetical protein